MTDAYVNIVTNAGAASEAADAVADIDAVDTVHVVTGEHDIVAQLDLDDPDALPGVVADEIHAVPGVAETVTNVAFEP
jgi:anthranilate phosphoribosyltransferase